MSDPIRPSELEEMMKDVVNVPEPDMEFLNSLRARFIAEGHASAKKNQETQMKQKVFSRRLTWALAILVLVSLVVLFTRPTVVNALKRLFGYVPNIGIVDRTSEVLVLTEPVTVTRENITVTVEQAVLTNEKTIIVYSYILPADFLIPDNTFGDSRSPLLVLPDGTRLEPIVGQHLNTMDCPQCSMRYALEFNALPSNVTGAILELPGLVAVPVELAPQDWKFPLNFKVADASDIIPVTEQVVTPAPTAAGSEPVSPYGITNTLDKFVALPDGYILYGNVSWTDPVIRPYGVRSQLVSIKDAKGAEIPFDYADSERYPAQDELRQYWAYKLNSMEFVGPLSLSFAVDASLPVNGGSFTFDPGPNPQLGQIWNINQDVTVNNEVIHVLSVEEAGIEEGFFMFTMQSDSNIIGATITDLAHPPMGGGGGGGGVPEVHVPFYSSFGYQVPIPQGPLTLTFTSVDLLIPGDWTLTWNP